MLAAWLAVAWCARDSRVTVPLLDRALSTKHVNTWLEFFKWWICIIVIFAEDVKRVLNSLNTLSAWILWKLWTTVFNGAIPNIQLVVRNILEEAQLWCIAGAKGLARLEVAAR
jgi:hypothetical protein